MDEYELETGEGLVKKRGKFELKEKYVGVQMKVKTETNRAERENKNTAQIELRLNVSHKEIAADLRRLNDHGLDHVRTSTSLTACGPRKK